MPGWTPIRLPAKPRSKRLPGLPERLPRAVSGPSWTPARTWTSARTCSGRMPVRGRKKGEVARTNLLPLRRQCRQATAFLPRIGDGAVRRKSCPIASLRQPLLIRRRACRPPKASLRRQGSFPRRLSRCGILRWPPCARKELRNWRLRPDCCNPPATRLPARRPRHHRRATLVQRSSHPSCHQGPPACLGRRSHTKRYPVPGLMLSSPSIRRTLRRLTPMPPQTRGIRARFRQRPRKCRRRPAQGTAATLRRRNSPWRRSCQARQCRSLQRGITRPVQRRRQRT